MLSDYFQMEEKEWKKEEKAKQKVKKKDDIMIDEQLIYVYNQIYISKVKKINR